MFMSEPGTVFRSYKVSSKSSWIFLPVVSDALCQTQPAANTYKREGEITTPRMPLKSKGGPQNGRLLLMGSSAFRAKELPVEVRNAIDEAVQRGMTIIVGETYGAGRLFQDYLLSKGYRNVIVGHAVRLRYNAGNWPVMQYGKDLKERERKMIEACDSAVVIWMNGSGVIAENLELLKRLRKPTFLYECSSDSNEPKVGPLDFNRTYDPFYWMKEYKRKQKARHQGR